MANRVCFLVDGFNVYHSVCEALRTRKGASMKWLDMQDLCASYLSSIGNGAILEKVSTSRRSWTGFPIRLQDTNGHQVRDALGVKVH